MSSVNPPMESPAFADEELLKWQLSVAQRADQLRAGRTAGHGYDRETWLRAEDEVLPKLFHAGSPSNGRRAAGSSARTI